MGFLAALAALWWFFLRRRRQRPQEQALQTGEEPWREGKYANAQELADPGQAVVKQYGELPAHEAHVHEMPARGTTASELPA